MLNQVVIVGRLTKDIQTIETEDGKKTTTITIAVPRSFKNADGVYDTDFVSCVLWNGIAENTAEYCHKGDVIGVKGRIQNKQAKNEDGSDSREIEVIAEKVTFLSSKKSEE